jgi:hypothetical protein
MTASGLSLDIIGPSPSRSLVLCLVSIDMMGLHRPIVAFVQPTSEIAFLQFVLDPGWVTQQDHTHRNSTMTKSTLLKP